MSDVPADYRERLNLREQIARIDRALVENHKFAEETQKFVAEQHKLMAEGRKFNRDPWMLVIGAIIAGAFTRLPDILHALHLQ
jgi:hypothetical protein